MFLLLFLFLPIVPHPQLYLLKLNYKAVLRVECLVEIQVLEVGGTGSLQASHSVNPLLPPKANSLTLARQNTQPLTPIQVAASLRLVSTPSYTPDRNLPQHSTSQRCHFPEACRVTIFYLLGTYLEHSRTFLL